MPVKLHPFINFFGGKYRAAPHYPAPRFPLIVEPFAGSAGYAVRHYDREVWLNDADPIIAGLWQYLVAVDEGEISEGVTRE